LQGEIGFSVQLPDAPEANRFLFSESPSRVLVSCDPQKVASVEAAARREGLEVLKLGVVGGDQLDLGVFSVSLEDAKERFETSLPRLLTSNKVEV